MKSYGICPNLYLSAPVLSWDAMISMTKIELELSLYIDMFFEKAIRGGVSYIYKRYSKTNDKCLKSYDPKEESNLIIY